MKERKKKFPPGRYTGNIIIFIDSLMSKIMITMHSSTCLYIQLILSNQAYDKDIDQGEDLHEIPMLYSWILDLFMFAKKKTRITWWRHRYT